MNIVKDFIFKNIMFNFSKLISSVNLKPIELVIKENEKALCLSPHADDESIGMAGVLTAFYDNFNVILLTDGRKGVKDKPVEEVINIRENEFAQAMNCANVKQFDFIRAIDKHLIDAYDKFKNIDISDYDYIFLPNVVDQHPDHKAVSILLSKLLSEKKHKDSLKICFYEVWSALSMVNAYFDISNFVDIKKQMINCYKSQIATKDYEYYSLGLNAYRGMFKDKQYVESFCILDVNTFKKFSKNLTNI